MSYKLIVIKKNCRTTDTYKEDEVGELIFKDKKTARLIGIQLIQQNIIEDCTIVKIEEALKDKSE